MPTLQDETLPQRYAREHQDYLKLCGSMTAEQVADIQLQLHNSLAREQALQQRLTAADEELDQCHSMALMIEEKEWAEHVGKGNISSRVESAFTQLHNELSEARQGLTAADERVDSAITFVTRLIECAGGQPSIATGYLRDILDELNPAEPAKDEHVCAGCGSKGWTANCKECVPY